MATKTFDEFLAEFRTSWPLDDDPKFDWDEPHEDGCDCPPCQNERALDNDADAYFDRD